MMADGVRRFSRRQAMQIASCVGSLFESRKTDWNEFIRTGQLKEPPPFELPDTPEMRRSMEMVERLKAKQEQNGNGSAGH